MRKHPSAFRNPPPPPQLHWLWRHGAVPMAHLSCATIWRLRRDQRRATSAIAH